MSRIRSLHITWVRDAPTLTPDARHAFRDHDVSARAVIFEQHTVFNLEIACVAYLSILQIPGFYFVDDLLLPLVEQQLFVVVKIFLTAVAADEAGTVEAGCQLCDED